MNNDYSPLVNDVITNDFPAFAELPKQKSRLGKLWDFICEFAALREKHGELLPRKLVATLLDVSVQRVDELEREGRLKRIDFHGHPYVTENSVVEHARSERKNGRPLKTLEDAASSPLKAWKVASQWHKENPIK